jgi:hypothetical protein
LELHEYLKTVGNLESNNLDERILPSRSEWMRLFDDMENFSNCARSLIAFNLPVLKTCRFLHEFIETTTSFNSILLQYQPSSCTSTPPPNHLLPTVAVANLWWCRATSSSRFPVHFHQVAVHYLRSTRATPTTSHLQLRLHLLCARWHREEELILFQCSSYYLRSQRTRYHHCRSFALRLLFNRTNRIIRIERVESNRTSRVESNRIESDESNRIAPNRTKRVESNESNESSQTSPCASLDLLIFPPTVHSRPILQLLALNTYTVSLFIVNRYMN